MPISPDLVWALVIAVASSGAAYGGVKSGLNGSRERIQKLELASMEHLKADAAVGERLSALETKIDYIARQLETM